MPTFLQLDSFSVGHVIRDMPSSPSPDWIPGTLANYKQRWNGVAWVDTQESQEFRTRSAADQAALVIAEKKKRQTATQAAILRASGSWAGLSAAQKSKVQAVIDAAAAAIIADFQS